MVSVGLFVSQLRPGFEQLVSFETLRRACMEDRARSLSLAHPRRSASASLHSEDARELMGSMMLDPQSKPGSDK